MKLLALTPGRELYAGDARSVVVPGVNGSFEILDNHAPIVSALGAGKVKITDTSGSVTDFDIENGFIEVLNNEVSVLIQKLA